MTSFLRKALLIVIAGSHALIGAGAGDRVVYFGAAHREATCCEHHEHEHRSWLHVLPLVLPAGPEHGRHHDHDCGHAHVQGHDATAASGPVSAPPAEVRALPVFLTVVRRSIADADIGPPTTPVETPPRPPDEPLPNDVRLLI
jgi:hypothetical protein